ncbi:MAG TPA: glycosyltransferase family 4 protein [Thermoanaerobaculia bacterium]|nr:glycosyltransferase family 4 protein [Thermoanaerobaculia bacterium]
MTILITHPGRQHSHQAALALEKRGLLAGYWSGVPADPARLSLPAAFRRRWLRYAAVPLPAARTRSLLGVPGLRRLGDALLPRAAAFEVDFAACRCFDRWAAWGMARLPLRGVLACEISARTQLERARSAGLLALLDAPAIHHLAQDRLHGFREPAGLHRRIVAVKEAEIALAHHVVTVSELARGTYLEAGVPAGKVHAVALGAELGLFAQKETFLPGALSILFCGATIYRKGFDLLVEAFADLLAVEPGATLTVVGPLVEEAHRLARLPSERVRAVGSLPQAALARELQRADLLVLPSRNDSYGMVVAEALATGTPVIVSDMVGAKELVVAGRTGWVVPAGEVASLAQRLLACARDREAVFAMRDECRRAAEGATWAAYHGRFADLIERLLAEHEGGTAA